MKLIALLFAAMLGSSLAHGQAMVEYGAIAAAASSAAGPASKMGKSLEKSLKALDGSLAPAAAEPARTHAKPQAATAADRRPARSSGSTPASTPLPKPSKEVLAAVQVGIDRSELIAKAGKPSFAIVSAEEELLSYNCKEGAAYSVVVKDGKVTEVREK